MKQRERYETRLMQQRERYEVAMQAREAMAKRMRQEAALQLVRRTLGGWWRTELGGVLHAMRERWLEECAPSRRGVPNPDPGMEERHLLEHLEEAERP